MDINELYSPKFDRTKHGSLFLSKVSTFIYGKFNFPMSTSVGRRSVGRLVIISRDRKLQSHAPIGTFVRVFHSLDVF